MAERVKKSRESDNIFFEKLYFAILACQKYAKTIG